MAASSSVSPATARFRSAIQAVKAAQRVVCGPQAGQGGSEGAGYRWTHSNSMDPGLDPTQPQPQLAHLSKLAVTVDLVDYSEGSATFRCFTTNASCGLSSLEQAIEAPLQGQLPDSKSDKPTVRWVNVNGLNWEVIRMLAIRYSLHPLALEDCLHASARSKTEHYKHHLFVHLAVHNLAEQSDPSSSPNKSAKPLFAQHQSNLEPELLDVDSHPNSPSVPRHITHHRLKRQKRIMELGVATSSHQIVGKEVYDEEREVIRRLTRDYTVRIHVEKLSIFLLQDGTLITIFSHDGSRTVLPLLDRLEAPDTLLRTSSDASMLLQALLDNVVDQALDVVEAFRSKLTGLEAKVLVSPDMNTVRHLHVLSGELLLLKRTLTPLSSLVNAIMHHDPVGSLGNEYPASELHDSNMRQSSVSSIGQSVPPPLNHDSTWTHNRQKFVSHQAKIYLTDVLDHIDTVLTSLELFSDLASNLVDFTFNTMSFSTNESMKQLSMVTIVFLPLTFLTGYFGMNFTDFELIQGSDRRFWLLAVPSTCLMVLAFTITGLRRRVDITWKKRDKLK